MNEHLPRVITRRELRQRVPYTPQHILRREQKSREGSDTVAAGIRKYLANVLTFFLRKIGF